MKASLRSLPTTLRSVVFGRPRDLTDKHIFHKVSLVAILAWVGLGADGLSSSCYGPEETYKALGGHPALALVVAVMCIGTIAIICASYAQIIELFPSGGGGYLVASKLLSPTFGLISGSALLVDYVLTITISVASGADAFFSLLDEKYLPYKFEIACAGVILLTLINLRGVKESVILCVPIFFLFLATHAGAILTVIGIHLMDIGQVAERTAVQIKVAHQEMGLLKVMALLLKAFSVGAGTYTGIEAVSNGLPILRQPRVATGKRTMLYMGLSLGITVFGLLLAYLLENVQPQAGKTLNAVLFEQITRNWPTGLANAFVYTSMSAAAVLLFIAAQAGFLDGPRVLANMAQDRWFPTRFTLLSDRLVTRNGILLMGGAALVAMLGTHGKVDLLVVLYSINVFITFSLSQLGMVMHWWSHRKTDKTWQRKFIVNGVGLLVTGFILVTLCIMKFHEGGWVTIVVTGVLVSVALLVKQHYRHTFKLLHRLEVLVRGSEDIVPPVHQTAHEGRTAVVLVNGYNGLGLHTFYNIFKMFPGTFGQFVFVSVGMVDTGAFKGIDELNHLRERTSEEAEKYVQLAHKLGYAARSETAIGIDVPAVILQLSQQELLIDPKAVFFGGQLSFTHETIFSRMLHNSIVFSLQKSFCQQGTPFVIVPARV